ncbi:hypothetical protein PQR62_09765 [Herbaspirillum lusitanum]|jgi:hypothetical protein|uniref:CSN8/PSMD8/EIF3K domain-containing protein n=1 Tax=Herbaspirillum lusitanum TaxID=213312 RepID=A0ABW9A9X1_9BURK
MNSSVPEHPPAEGRLKNSDAIRHLLAISNDNEKQILANHPELTALVSDIQAALDSGLRGAGDQNPIPVLLCQLARSYYLGAVRLILSGQVSAIFPVLRAALESISFAVLAAQSLRNADIWLNREKSTRAWDRCANLYRFPEAVKVLRNLDPDLALAFTEYHDASLADVAPPRKHNAFFDAQLKHLVQDGSAANLARIYLPPSGAIFKALDASVRYGCLILAGLQYALPQHTPSVNASRLSIEIWGEIEALMNAGGSSDADGSASN